MTCKLLKEQQVAEILGLSTKSLQAWRLYGKGPRYRKIGRSVRYPEADLEAWISRQPAGGGDDVGGRRR